MAAESIAPAAMRHLREAQFADHHPAKWRSRINLAFLS